jgi:hypothetical protein
MLVFGQPLQILDDGRFDASRAELMGRVLANGEDGA